ncbi:hypothetical protein RSOCI_03785 [Rhabdochlamydiaceae symbiont of Dictyostelium giganteum]
MGISTKVLTNSGLTKIPFTPSCTSDQKIRLYFFSDQTPEAIAKIQTLFELEMNGKHYQGWIHTMFQDILAKPYLLKKGSIFKLISEEKVLELQKNISFSTPLKQNEDAAEGSDCSIQDETVYQHQAPFTVRDSIQTNSCLRWATNMTQRISILGKELFQNIYLGNTLSYLVDKVKQGVKYLTSWQNSSSGAKICHAHSQPQEISFHQIPEHQRKIISNRIWQAVVSQLGKVIKDKKRDAKEVYPYLNHLTSLLDEKHFNIGLDEVQRTEMFLLLDQLFNEEFVLQTTRDQSFYIHVKEILHWLSRIYLSLEEHHQLIKCHEKELEIALELQNPHSEEIAYYNLGNAYRSLGKYHQALEYYQKGIKMAQEFNEPVREAVYCNLGGTYASLEEYPIALDYYKKSLKSAQELNDTIAERRAYSNLGLTYHLLGDFHEAIEFHEKALKSAEQFDDEIEEETYSHLGDSYSSLKEYDKAVECYEKALSIALKLKDFSKELNAYEALGTSYHALGEYHKTINCYEKGLGITLKLKDQSREGIFYSELGCAYHSLGKYHKAAEYHNQALKIALELKDMMREEGAYRGLGNAYHSLGKYHKAIKYHEKDLTLALGIQNKAGEEKAYNNLGIAYRVLGEYQKAIQFQERALKIALGLKDQASEGRSYNNLGMVYRDLGEYQRAIDYHYQHLKMTIILKDRLEEGKAYGNLGNLYLNIGNAHKAIEYHKKDLQIALERGDGLAESLAYSNLGSAYSDLGDAHKAIEYHEKDLAIVQGFKDTVREGIAYSGLGKAYGALGEHLKAIEFHKKSLIISRKSQTIGEEGKVYCYLGNAYEALGKYHKAIKYYQKYLVITQQLENLVAQGFAYGGLGNAHHALGEHRKAIEYHHEHLKIALKFEDRPKEKRAYCGLGNAYCALKEYPKAIEYHEKNLIIALELQNKSSEGIAYCNLGNAYIGLGESLKAIEYYEKYLEIALELKDQVGEGIAYGNLGSACKGLGDWDRALYCYKKNLAIVERLDDRLGKGRVYCNLGNVYANLGDYIQAEQYMHKSVEIVASLQQDAKEAQWQITLFEEWALSYTCLERILLIQGKHRKALEISDQRRSRALTSLLCKKLQLQGSLSLGSLSFQEVSQLARKFHTTFIIYSLVPSQDKCIQAWVISSQRAYSRLISLASLEDNCLGPDQIFKAFPYQIETKRPKRGEKHPSQLFSEKLISWYDTLIAPIEHYLPSLDSGETLTFIPDGFLAHLPFGAFYQIKQDKYLIEQYPIVIVPSLQVLSLLDQFPKTLTDQALLMGNPTTPQEEDNQLKHSESEVRDVISPLMKASHQYVLTQQEATTENVFKYAPHSRWIHIACHGVAGQKPQNDPHSVFEGFFKLAPDEKHKAGELHAKEVNLLTLKADLVFMSACHLGRGNIQKEGSIGPVWSFLGSGALSTIASYWPLPEGDMTVQMVKTFYQHYLGIHTPKLSKAKALQQAVLMAMKTERDKPRQWGSFFLSGLMN